MATCYFILPWSNKLVAKDQYDEAISISCTVEITLNGIPLANTAEISISDDTVTVTGKLVAGDTLSRIDTSVSIMYVISLE